MRKIKFRVWDKENREMIYPECCEMHEEWFLSIGGQLCKLLNCDMYDNSSEVMQFTGLLDSDGMEIYEGDILELLIERYEIVGGCFDDRDQVYNETNEVIFENGCFKAGEWLFDDIVGDSRGDGCDFILSAKVIGNRCEKPELLEAQK